MNGGRQAAVLCVRGLNVSIREGRSLVPIVRDLDFDLAAGEVLALVGESGCGKTKTAEAIMGLVPARTGTVHAESIVLSGQDISAWPDQQLSRLRGREISMVFQDARTALDPVFSIGAQLTAVIRRHRRLRRREARQAAEAMLERVGFADRHAMLRRYPHELSGGQCQRVVIAMAMACRPRVLIADEPTTALDVTTQAQVLTQLIGLAAENDTAVLLITHDLGIVAQFCDRALVMREGRKVEEAEVDALFHAPREAYTRKLLDAARESVS